MGIKLEEELPDTENQYYAQACCQHAKDGRRKTIRDEHLQADSCGRAILLASLTHKRHKVIAAAAPGATAAGVGRNM